MVGLGKKFYNLTIRVGGRLFGTQENFNTANLQLLDWRYSWKIRTVRACLYEVSQLG